MKPLGLQETVSYSTLGEDGRSSGIDNFQSHPPRLHSAMFSLYSHMYGPSKPTGVNKVTIYHPLTLKQYLEDSKGLYAVFKLSKEHRPISR